MEAALAELDATEQQVIIRIVQEPRRGVLGLGSQPAVVKVRLKEGHSDVDEEVLEEQADVAADFLEGLLERMGLSAEVETNLVDGNMYVDIWGDEDDTGILIGRHGATVDALQDLVRAVVQRRTDERCRILVDVEDYRKRRRSQLEARARDVARRVARTGKQEAMPPMNPYERKIVHDAVAAVGGLETVSEGEEPERRVVVRRPR
ncbi:MAG: KH domain-containing protein [Actinobacteria bacterium]|nr:KH domain-containing protein [Actinomycetota bacterium]